VVSGPSRAHRRGAAGAPTDWVPSKPIWFTEIGCGAIDKGTNQPNKFLDWKSSESGRPHFSSGRRDDLIQARYLRAMLEYWADPAVNPESTIYGGRMLDVSRTHAWAWDARPFPAFPRNAGLWSDGANYRTGHWLNGRTEAEELGAVIRELCAAAGVEAVDVSDVHGLVRGFAVEAVGPARAALQQLILAHGLDVVERDGQVVFSTRRARTPVTVDEGALAVEPRLEADLARSRAPEAELAGRVRLSHAEAAGDYAQRVAEAVLPGDGVVPVAESELPMTLLPEEGQALAERWLAEARVARDSARFALPPSRQIAPGDVVALPGDPAQFRVDRVERGLTRLVEAVRIEPGVWEPADRVATGPQPATPFVAPVPVLPLFLDLPLMTGEEVPHAPHLAVVAEPWPGSVAVYSAVEDAGYALDRLVETGAVFGVTETPMAAAAPGRVDRGAPLRLRLTSGTLASVTEAQLAAGANLFAIGDGSPGGWELFQARDAVPLAEGVWGLAHRLRGQQGSEAEMAPVWPAGAYVVKLDGTLGQIGYPAEARGQLRHFRIGPAGRSYDDPSYVHAVHAFEARGLRPYAPVHLRGTWLGGDLALGWVRRTRVGGDAWDLADVPLGEAREQYLVRIEAGGAVVREATAWGPDWVYGAGLRASDGVAGQRVTISVAQVSERVGAGVFARRDFDV
jgi:hypothetical protein